MAQSIPPTTAAAHPDPSAIHIPVMSEQVVELLSPALDHEGAVYVDGTVGLAGHASLILQANPRARLIGIDQDGDALALAARRLDRFGGRAHLVRARFDELPRVLDDLGVHSLDAMLLDLGLSSLQIDRPERGFAYRTDAPLDMRMDDRNELTAARVLNDYEPGRLVGVLREYGEERQAARIVRAIVAEREKAPFENSARLVRVIESAIPAAVRARSSGHPARRTFQALRIEVNGELKVLQAVLPHVLARMTVGARLAVLAYHSLEDRIVKQVFAKASQDSAPAGLPVVPDELAARFALVTHGAQRPSAEELAANPRSASARLRVLRRIRAESTGGRR
ncbi:16S rRNA (cytosine1402-N4)-methyltransferase [Propionibacterium cyclohexanicum]|uniref:Ribosomal RNA small subunit methyltransferase H n=1 Tax=Propionibacterium cyclohexanicum TaxID=64702 RepID=A0A1H9PIZ7_9ACTN|nr:16S rRNA (cytosine(1402)-N(4))-methyltransferase RsmH [Propionibacterium cyclohexanicum]SER48211.1 16S rRNA (cytosine1402-N4)-methyltransferase [Propionibacterium cyclohexanicum]